MYFCTGIFVINFGTIEIIIYLVNGNILRLLEVVHCQADNAIRHSIQTQLLVSHMPSSPRQIVATVVGNHPPYIYIIFLGVNIAFFPPHDASPSQSKRSENVIKIARSTVQKISGWLMYFVGLF